MNALKRQALIQEFEDYLSSLFFIFDKEVPYKSIMPTKRMFRADYLCHTNNNSQGLLIEINGGQFKGGRHNRGGEGYERDLTKINTASVNGFVILQFTYEMLERLEYKDIIK